MNATANIIKALETFFGSFGLPVYPEDSVPDRDLLTGENVRPPYITVRIVAPDWRGAAPFYARVWYRGYDYAQIAAKVDEIATAIGEGASIPTETGAVYIWKEDNFCQFQPMAGDIDLKCAYLSMSLMAHTN